MVSMDSGRKLGLLNMGGFLWIIAFYLEVLFIKNSTVHYRQLIFRLWHKWCFIASLQ